MAEETLLSDLCSCCNINKPKYRCPGCAARTCSLSCYKRHQQRAQCSGKRDPTKFVKKSQLATPAGIDHDFNFLTGIERGLQKADQDINQRIPNAEADARRAYQKGHVTEKRLADAGVTVIRAPQGLTRQKENKTHLSGKRNIVWSVEWIHEDKRRLLSEFSEIQPIEEAYRGLIGLHSQKNSRKRKREAQEAKRGAHDATTVEKHETTIAPHDEKAEPPSEERQQLSVAETKECAEEPDTNIEVEGRDLLCPDVDEPKPKYVSQHHFFLLRPRTSSSRPVLVPVAPSSTLSATLRNRTILEYPTIYVFTMPVPPPGKFILENDYLKQSEAEQKEMEGILKGNPEALLGFRGEDEATQAEEVDTEKVLDVLKQDLGILDQQL